MNWRWIWSIIAWVRARCLSLNGEKGSSMPLLSPAVMRRRSTPNFSIVPVKPKLSISTPIEPTIEALST